MSNEKSGSWLWLVAPAAILLLLGAGALGLASSGVVLGLVLVALGLRLAVMFDAVHGPEAPAAAGQVPAPGRHPERLHPAHV